MNNTNCIIAIVAIALSSCSDKKETTDNISTPYKNNGIASVIVNTEPKDAQAIYKTRKTAVVGDVITVHGKVMGRIDPFVPGRAIMVLGDPQTITSCDLIPDDVCETPWDVCCDDPDTIKDSTLTIQVVDTDGNLIKSGFKGVANIKELSQLVVKGVVAEGSNKDNLLLNATAVFVKP